MTMTSGLGQTRLTLKNNRKEVVVRIRPSLGGIDVIVHGHEGMELERRLTGLTVTEASA